MNNKKINMILNIIGIIVVCLVVLWALSHIKYVVFLFFGAVLLAYLLKPPVDFLCTYGFSFRKKEKCDCKGIPRTISIVIVYAILLLVITFFISFAVPIVQSEAYNFVNNFLTGFEINDQVIKQLANHIPPTKLKSLRELIDKKFTKEELCNALQEQEFTDEEIKFVLNEADFAKFQASILENLNKVDKWAKPKVPEEMYNRIKESIFTTIQESLQAVGAFLKDMVLKGGIILGTIFSTLATVFLVPLLAFLLLKDTDTYKKWFLNLFPIDWRKELLSVLSKIDKGLGGFIRGQILVCICIGFSAIIALSIFRIDYAVFLGTVVGILNIVPFAGPILGAIPPLLLALATKPPIYFFGLLIAFLLIHELEKQVISPALVGHSVGLPPIVIIISVLAGAELFGFVGVLIAVPLTLTLRVILMYFHQRWESTWPENSLRDISSVSDMEMVGDDITGILEVVPHYSNTDPLHIEEGYHEMSVLNEEEIEEDEEKSISKE